MSSTPQTSSDNELGYIDALIVCGAVMALAVALIALKGVFYFFLDMCIELDGGSRRRCVIEVLRKMFPFWHVRTQPMGPRQNEQQNTPQNAENADNAPLSLEELIETLPTQILSPDDVKEWQDSGDLSNSKYSKDGTTTDIELGQINSMQPNDKEGSSSDESTEDGHQSQQGESAEPETKEIQHTNEHEASSASDDLFPCSICLQGMHVGDKVFRCGSGHPYHVSCIAQWIVSSRERAAMLADRRQRTSSLQRHEHPRTTIECPICRLKLDH